ncbi:MAG: dihydroorotase [Fimbriimonadaceae bacterium]|nr:dihydroorotase [Fimbriimonadaceae bacterium]
MRYDLLIRGGTVYSSELSQKADIGVIDGKIVELGDLKQSDAETVLDATGLAVLPGIIDTQVHFREPGMEHKEDLHTGSRAAIAGGVTTVFEMPNTSPTTTTRSALEDKLSRASGRMFCNFGFFVGASSENADELTELERLPGTPGVKIFMGSSTGTLLVGDDDTLRRVLKSGKGRCPIHAEDSYRLEERKSLMSDNPHPREHPFLRDPECARLATERILRLSEETGRPVHVLHLSTADEIPLIQEAKKRGLNNTVEATPQHLYFAAPEIYDRLGTFAQMNPPLRESHHRDALRQAMKDGFFDVIGSDHAPHTIQEKQQSYPKSPSGMPGVQTILPVMMTLAKQTQILDIHQFIKLSCENPTKLYGIKSKGFLKPGYDADIVIADLNKTWSPSKNWLQSKCGWSPYEGELLTGWPIHVVVNGNLSVVEMEIQGSPLGKMVEFDWK